MDDSASTVSSYLREGATGRDVRTHTNGLVPNVSEGGCEGGCLEVDRQ